MQSEELSTVLKQRAQELGFPLLGICSAVSPPGVGRLDEWLAAGYAGQMHYIADRREAYEHPRHVLDGVRSVMMLAMPYLTDTDIDTNANATSDGAGQGTSGKVARYAQGAADYHDVLREKLHKLADYLRTLVPTATTRGVVDTAPLLEREFAQLAGLGWIGKNTLLLSPQAGSYFFLAALLTDQTLAYDTPFAADHCGTCTACLDACPTDAFAAPYVLNASRCISYLTIELQDVIPVELRAGMGDWVFGCDVCQEVCPWNRGVAQTAEAVFASLPELSPLELRDLFDLDEAGFRKRFRHTPLWRAHRRGLLRNAAIVLGNRREAAAIPALAVGLQDEDPLVRGAVAWALGQFNTPEARQALHSRNLVETDPKVQSEIVAVHGKR